MCEIQLLNLFVINNVPGLNNHEQCVEKMQLLFNVNEQDVENFIDNNSMSEHPVFIKCQYLRDALKLMNESSESFDYVVELFGKELDPFQQYSMFFWTHDSVKNIIAVILD